jgi:hypothetical protein
MPNFTVPRRVFDPTFAERVRDANPLEQVVNGDLLSAGHRALTGTGDERAGWHPKSSHTTLAHWQRTEACNSGASWTSSVRISCGVI